MPFRNYSGGDILYHISVTLSKTAQSIRDWGSFEFAARHDEGKEKGLRFQSPLLLAAAVGGPIVHQSDAFCKKVASAIGGLHLVFNGVR